MIFEYSSSVKPQSFRCVDSSSFSFKIKVSILSWSGLKVQTFVGRREKKIVKLRTMEGHRLARRASLAMVVVPVLMISGNLASYSNGRSRYQEFTGCNETVIQAPEKQEPPAIISSDVASNYKPVVLGPQEFQVGDRMASPAVGFSNNRFTLPTKSYNPYYQNYQDEEDKQRVPFAASLLGTSRLAQFRQSAMAIRSQITGNRFFDPDHSSVGFTLFTRANPQTGQKLQVHNRDSLESSEFNAEKPTKVIIHGFSEIGALGEWVGHLRDAYLTATDANVIVADFSTFETFLLFWTNLPVFASKRIADLITFLELTKGVSRESFHLIARSFGTHVAGVTGRLLQGKLGRITGLEPEPRVYGSVLPDYKLLSTDAQFVDIVRVNGRRYYFHGARFGLAPPAGHVDIYPNYAERNDGCPGRTIMNYGRSNFAYCQTGRGVTYFTDSIKNPQAHPMCQCNSFTEYKNGGCVCTNENSIFYLGEYMNNQTRGVFQLQTPITNRNLFRGLRFFG